MPGRCCWWSRLASPSRRVVIGASVTGIELEHITAVMITLSASAVALLLGTESLRCSLREDDRKFAVTISPFHTRLA